MGRFCYGPKWPGTVYAIETPTQDSGPCWWHILGFVLYNFGGRSRQPCAALVPGCGRPWFDEGPKLSSTTSVEKVICLLRHQFFRHLVSSRVCSSVIKGDSNPNDKYVLSERALWTMNFDTSIIKISWKMGIYNIKNSIWPTFSRHFEYLISFQNFFNCLIFSYHYYHIICVSADM